jgi:hypothetical protein
MFRMRINPAAVLAALALVTASAIGCGGGQEAQVTGVVTLDGQPLTRGSVTFVPVEGGPGASATINSDGAFSARTGSTAGLRPGEYAISVRSSGDPTADPNGGPPKPGKLLTPPKYGSTETSGFRETVNPGANEINLDLKS